MISSCNQNKIISDSAKPTTTNDFSMLISSPEWVKHLQQIEESEGFDIDVFPTKCYYTNVDVQLHNNVLVDLIDNYALPKFNSEKGSCYRLTKVEKAVVCSICYFITFKAKYKKKEKTFQTKCCVSRNHKRVMFTRLKHRVSEGGQNSYDFKNPLQGYCRKGGLPAPVYETINEGHSDEPAFRSTVIVNDVRYESLTGFSNKRTAEQSASEVALVQLSRSGEIKLDIITQPENYEYAVIPIKKKPELSAEETRIALRSRLRHQLHKQKKKQRSAALAAARGRRIARENSNGSVVHVSSHEPAEPTNEGCHDGPAEVPEPAEPTNEGIHDAPVEVPAC